VSFGAELIEQLDRAAGLRPAPRLTSNPQSPRGFQARLRYITAVRTGASLETVARLARVTPNTVRIWMSGTRLPTAANRARVDEVYQQFADINQQAKYETARRRASKRLLLAVVNDALHVTNLYGDSRYWKPSTTWWPRFIARWIRVDAAGLDDDWDHIVSAWDYPEPWEADMIEYVEIV